MSQSFMKDFINVWNRLFDHRPYLSGEISHFCAEFEVKRGNREITRLAEATECIDDIRSYELNKAVDVASDLTKVITLLDISLQTSETILEVENNCSLKESFTDKYAILKTERDKINAELDEERSKIDQKFDEKKEELIQFYESVEKQFRD